MRQRDAPQRTGALARKQILDRGLHRGLHHHWDKNIRRCADFHAKKLWRRDPDDGERVPGDRDSAAYG